MTSFRYPACDATSKLDNSFIRAQAAAPVSPGGPSRPRSGTSRGVLMVGRSDVRPRPDRASRGLLHATGEQPESASFGFQSGRVGHPVDQLDGIGCQAGWTVEHVLQHVIGGVSDVGLGVDGQPRSATPACGRGPRRRGVRRHPGLPTASRASASWAASGWGHASLITKRWSWLSTLGAAQAVVPPAGTVRRPGPSSGPRDTRRWQGGCPASAVGLRARRLRPGWRE